MTTSTLLPLNTTGLKKGLKAYGINALVRKYKGNTVSVFVKSEDIDRTKAFFTSLNIKRVLPLGQIVAPFEVNGGEFNGLIRIAEHL